MQQSGPSWQAVQNQNLPAKLSGHTNFVPAAALDLKGKYIRLPILMYHHIGEIPQNAVNDEVRKGLTVSPANFEEQMSWLSGAGYHSVSLEDLLKFSQGEFKMPDNPIIITFDDGYEDALLNAPPILKKYGFSGSFAIITQFPGIKYGTNVYATWQEIRSAKNQGMEIVSHTQDHFDGSNAKYDDGFILRNLQGARKDLKDNLGVDTQILIYPFGHYTQNYINLAKQAGYEIGVTTRESKQVELDKLMEVPRVRISDATTLPGFKKLLSE